MATNPADIQIESALVSSKMVGAMQMQEAKDELERRALTGENVSLAEILVSRGVITDTIRRNFEKATQEPPKSLQMLGHYKLIKKLGQGGMGTVYLAEDTADKSQVAVKILPEKFAGDPELLARFRRETKAAFRLRHENIAVAYGEGEQNGVSYYTMEYCDGEPLDALQKRLGAMPLHKALDILIQIARGLKYAHDNGIIHRDIKPANIFMTRSGIAKILDMGLSKDIEADELSFNTASGTVLGTAHYLSPEQAKGERQIDGRADIYSLGATLYSLVTGTTPFKGATQALVMMKHISEPLPNPKEIAKDLPDSAVQFIQKMMAKNPEDRYQNCDEVIREIERIQAAIPKAPPAPPPTTVIAALPTDETKTGLKLPPVQSRAPSARTPKAFTPAPAARASLAASAPAAAFTPAVQPSPAKSRAPLLAGGVALAALIAGGVWYAVRDKGAPAEMEKAVVVKEDKPLAAPAAVKAAPAPVEEPHALKVDFESVDLGKMQSRKPELLSIGAQAGHGKVLHMRVSPNADDPTQLDIALPIEKVRGQTLEGSVLARAADASKPGQAFIELRWVVSRGEATMSSASFPIKPGSGDWSTFTFRHRIPDRATEAYIRIARNDAGGGEIYVDDLTADIAK